MPLPYRPGDPVPKFRLPALSGNPQFSFDTVAGRYILMLFFGSAAQPATAEALALVEREAAVFDDVKACFFGVTADPTDEAEGRIAQVIPGRRFFLDYQGGVSKGYGAVDEEGRYRPYWLLLDIDMRVLGAAELDRGAALIDLLRRLPPPGEIDRFAPVIVIPNVFERDVCRNLVELYDANGGEDSGFMREVDGKTVGLIDHSHKKRSDWVIDDDALRADLRRRIERRLVPEIRKAFQFPVSRMERYIVARYDGDTGGYFRPHRDNTTSGTAHRRFACTINLNAEEYDGGDLRFPEYGKRTYRAPTGGAVVFSCSLLHEACPVTRGARYAFLPFLYDEAAAEVREANNPNLGEGLGEYKKG
ncbi:MAG: 2OG-Fe(II) oxygenase [Sphingomonadaceae bacterium]|nr:2OG-Fe(II) oxygenase [Sphingomonadaceae bacterium]